MTQLLELTEGIKAPQSGTDKSAD